MTEFKKESELCAAFISWVKAIGGKKEFGITTPVWTPYAETAGWDILLVAEDGTQIGIEAKLKFNMKVLAQAVPDNYDLYRDRGPDFRAVLVPKRDESAEKVCRALGLTLICPRPGWNRDGAFEPNLNMSECFGTNPWHYWSPRERCHLPAYIPDVVAGCAAPVQLTDWKVKALRLLALLELRGWVTREDFKTLRLDHRAWVGPQGWVVPTDVPGQYVRGKADFDTQHATVYTQVLADERKTYVPPTTKDPVQPSLLEVAA